MAVRGTWLPEEEDDNLGQSGGSGEETSSWYLCLYPREGLHSPGEDNTLGLDLSPGSENRGLAQADLSELSARDILLSMSSFRSFSILSLLIGGSTTLW